MPGEFRINLPIKPTGASADLDNNGTEDQGVQVYLLAVASSSFSRVMRCSEVSPGRGMAVLSSMYPFLKADLR